ncbi:hypothetical protein FS749_013387 [Ceratobasidium sp. UAMH 11750]|nr:hypothetical protein FS749_013387 [Ceratobasidium sp. UAMH 11750]
MASLFYELSAVQVVSLATIHTALQGSFIPLLATFLSANRKTSKRFRAYVVSVHVVALGQTIMHISQVFDLVGSRRPLPLILLAHPLLTIMLNASVQGFFLFRCWCIFRRRLLCIAPFLVLFVAAAVSGLLTAIYHMESSAVDVTYEAQVKGLSTWILSSFLLDLCMTTTTMIYLYRSRTGLGEHNGAFSAIWQITWVSAAPPLILMIAVIVVARGIQGLSQTQVIFVADMTGKFFVLSLMISLVGRGYIRQKLDGLSNKHVDLSDTALPKTTGVDGSMFIPGVSIKVETTRTFASSQVSTIPHRVSLVNPEQREDPQYALTMSRFNSGFDVSLPIESKKPT